VEIREADLIGEVGGLVEEAGRAGAGVRAFRSALYAASHASSGHHVPRYYVAEWRRFPFGSAYQPFSRL
jgi:hypothetical protein